LLGLHRRSAGLGVDSVDAAVCRHRVEHSVGGTHIDADPDGGTFDVGLPGHLFGGRIDPDQRFSVDETDDGRGVRRAGGGQRSDERACNCEGFGLYARTPV
jgi:hypothetical protein